MPTSHYDFIYRLSARLNDRIGRLENTVLLTKHQHLSRLPSAVAGGAYTRGGHCDRRREAWPPEFACGAAGRGVRGCSEQHALRTGLRSLGGRPLAPATLGSSAKGAGTDFLGKWPWCCASGRKERRNPMCWGRGSSHDGTDAPGKAGQKLPGPRGFASLRFSSGRCIPRS